MMVEVIKQNFVKLIDIRLIDWLGMELSYKTRKWGYMNMVGEQWLLTNITDGLHIDIFWTNLLVESTEMALLTENENKLKIIKDFEICRNFFFLNECTEIGCDR